MDVDEFEITDAACPLMLTVFETGEKYSSEIVITESLLNSSGDTAVISGGNNKNLPGTPNSELLNWTVRSCSAVERLRGTFTFISLAVTESTSASVKPNFTMS